MDPAPSTRGTPEANAGLGVYVHFPWCLRKCPYCDFSSVAVERSGIPHAGYASRVIDELERRAGELAGQTLASVFLGGGTPSLWEPAEIGRVLAAIRRQFPGENPEVTVECNPTSFDEGRARALMDAGVGRVSIGVQGLDEQRLRFLGRLHDVAGGLAAVRAAVRAGVPRVSADMIFGVAGQSSREAADEARRVAELGVTHLSAYALTLEPGTPFGALAKAGRLPLLGEDEIAESFLAVDRTLGALGFEHYEISNFARDGHVAGHNVGYWRGNDYLGLGAGAWGTLTLPGGRVRYRNAPSPARYLDTDWATADLGRAASELEPLSPETSLSERILLGLRMASGLDLAEAAASTGATAWTAERERAAERLVQRGRLARDGDRIWIPREAWLLADGTISELL